MSLKNKAENEPLEMTSLHLQVRYHKLTMTGKRTHAPPLSCLDTASHNYAGILSPLRRKKAFIVKWHALGPTARARCKCRASYAGVVSCCITRRTSGSKGLQCRTAAVPTPAVPRPLRHDNAASLAYGALQGCNPACVRASGVYA